MAISSEFRIEQYRDDDHREGAPHFIGPSLSISVTRYHLIARNVRYE